MAETRSIGRPRRDPRKPAGEPLKIVARYPRIFLQWLSVDKRYDTKKVWLFKGLADKRYKINL